MAVQALNDLQIGLSKNWAGLTTDNHLSAIGARDPQLVSDIVTQIHNKQGRLGIDTFFSKYPTKYVDTDADIKWYLKGDDERAIKIVTYSAADSNRPGVGKSVFNLTLAENNYTTSDFIIFDDRRFGVRIISPGVPAGGGTNWTYEVQMMTNSLSDFIPPALLAEGRSVSKQHSVVTSTLNQEYSQTEYSTHFEMRNQFTMLSHEQIVPGNIANHPLVIKMKGPEGEELKTWTRYQDVVTEWEWRRKKANHLMYAGSNKNLDGTYDQRSSNGFVIKQGAGLREQISPSYKFYYNTLTLDFLWEMGFNLSVNTKDMDDREFLLLTGERGMVKFHKLIEQNVALLMPFGNDKRLGGSGQALELTGQYIRFKGPQGITYTVMHMPEYDNSIHNRLDHPEGGQTENYRYTMMNIGTTDGEPNIQKYCVKGRDAKWYVAGSTSPYGPQTGGMGSSKVDGYQIFYQTTQLLKLTNPLSCAELIPNIVY